MGKKRGRVGNVRVLAVVVLVLMLKLRLRRRKRMGWMGWIIYIRFGIIWSFVLLMISIDIFAVFHHCLSLGL